MVHVYHKNRLTPCNALVSPYGNIPMARALVMDWLEVICVVSCEECVNYVQFKRKPKAKAGKKEVDGS